MIGDCTVPGLLFVAGAAALLGAPAAAQTDTAELTGRELYELCAGDDEFCVGFIAGAVSTTRAWALGGGLANVPFCLPDGTTDEQFAQAYVAWAEQNPVHLDEIAAAAVHEAIAAAAPC